MKVGNKMLEQILTALSTALVAVLVAIIPIIGAYVISFVNEKIKAVQVKTGAEKYNTELDIAQNVWGIVDEYFRITSTVTATIEAKINMFEAEILKKIPYLTKDEIDHLRQAVAGIVNQTKEVIIAPAIIITPPAIVENTEVPIANN